MSVHSFEQHEGGWRLRLEPREWQHKAFALWSMNRSGVVSVVTGGGKTVFAFQCMLRFREEFPDARFIIVVPTITLLDQWAVAAQEELGVSESEITCYSSQEKSTEPNLVNILVINSARRLAQKIGESHPTMLIVDECHRAGSPENAKALWGEYAATLGLSATPHREYDEGFSQLIEPALGPVIFEYDYTDAFRDKVIAAFDLINVRVDLLPHEQAAYDKLTRQIAILMKKLGRDPGLEDKLKRLLQRRAGISATAEMRVPVSAKLVEQSRGSRTIVFHERVSIAETIYRILRERRHSVCLYHSKLAPGIRRDNLRLFRRGVFDVLVSCRALDEGMNVPETAVAVIASSTASQRQRIQRLGRVLRPAKGKNKATIYTIYATDQEHERLMREASRLEEVTKISWLAGGRRRDV
jgi:superfamily II DNA or RNA helicase